ncbi:1-(5-phosphoribosyl)-5-[(5-phosphoribosylamino)methylideneamino]imidazole-4-carboxamide isomerase [Pollutibacter soli]|uniref:1-(5-phosphoribosyl)-5-[(5- phosphoribosylamino)methylideneamino]imidazole-4- carboxamide isomerase n=1 Tax=Pollutibacter soli TaxID=3034157 RepID=UPI003013856C
MEIIPAIDIIGGKCVRLTQGDYNQQTTYHDDPVEVAIGFEKAGFNRLHLVDLDGAKKGAVQNIDVLKNIVAATDLIIDFGGGVKTAEAVNEVLESGAAYVTVGSIAVKNRNELLSWFEHFGAGSFVLGADVIGRNIAIHGWTEKTDTDLFSFLESYYNVGIREVFCTDVSKDGKLQGPSTELYREIIERFPDFYFIASGGVSGIADLDELKKVGCSAAIIGKAIYEGRLSSEELVRWFREVV